MVFGFHEAFCPDRIEKDGSRVLTGCLGSRSCTQEEGIALVKMTKDEMVLDRCQCSKACRTVVKGNSS